MRETGRWRQVNLWCHDWEAAEQMAVTRLLPILDRAEAAGSISSWWFTRKGACWRLRLLPAAGQDDQADALLDATTAALTGQEVIGWWAPGIYEPEARAFGGTAGMQAAHAVFHADSRHLLHHLAQARAGDRPEHRRELALMLPAIMMTAAGQDWYEQGDIWMQVAAHRGTGPQPEPARPAAEAVHQLLTAASPAPGSPLREAPGWPAAFQHAGEQIAGLARRGTLTRGIRAVLAHHILFAWNRLGIPARQQHQLAATAATVIFGGPRHAAPPAGYDPATVAAVTTGTTRQPGPAQLRDALADHIARLGTFRTRQVETAFRTVPRHLFLPGTSLAEAYAPRVVITKRDADGTALSSASSPNVVAAMLEQLDARPGHRVLEIGTGTGINAALLAELAGPAGQVTTIDIDGDIVTAARRALAAAGYHQVRVLCGDGAAGHPDGGPYDRIIVTAGAWDLPAPWWQQLTDGGRLVVPLRLHGSGLTRSVAFDCRDGHLASNSARVCGFVPMRGDGAASGGHALQLAGDVTLNLDAADGADEQALAKALTYPAREQWTSITIGDREPAEHLDLWLATTARGFARLTAGPGARDTGLARPAPRWAGAALYDGGTIAYLTVRGDPAELGIIAHGPSAATLAGHTAGLLRTWAQDRPSQPVITAHPARTPGSRLPAGTRIERPGCRLTISW
jgi:protein-L-isoaspartate(D-aspartate) O-methyltransferase